MSVLGSAYIHLCYYLLFICNSSRNRFHSLLIYAIIVESDDNFFSRNRTWVLSWLSVSNRLSDRDQERVKQYARWGVCRGKEQAAFEWSMHGRRWVSHARVDPSNRPFSRLTILAAHLESPLPERTKVRVKWKCLLTIRWKTFLFWPVTASLGSLTISWQKIL